MALFKRREIPINIVFDDVKFQQIVTQVRELVDLTDLSVARLDKARLELDKSRKDLDKSVNKLQTAKRTTIRNSA